ncbi:glycosyl hydrolase family 28-related protein [Streptomyces hirsutus]|uniref:glycosyl hydrolase family 28-related protein n=1 Tax=Streptomyces hirsutus TaxID=35620 RepID=UPI0033235FB9
MALPANYATVPVFGRYIDFTGAPMQGTVTFTPSQRYVTNPGADVLIFSAPLVATLDGTGAFSIEIPSTDDPDVTPQGFTWAVAESFNRRAGRSFSIAVPQDTPEPGIDLVTVAPVLPADQVEYIVTSVDGMTGTVSLAGKYAPLDEDGKIPAENIPPISGGVTSVNGQSGIVSLGSADVGALPITGGTMQGPLNLAEEPTDPPQAATKAYVDTLSRRFDVMTYGATADEETDDSGAVQAAIDAASAAGGGVVLVPQGTYRIATPLVMKTRVTLQGVGKGVSILSAPANDLITFTAHAFWWNIRDLTLKVIGGGHVINGSYNLSAFGISHCSLQQLGADHSIWYQYSGQIVEAYLSFSDLYVDGVPRSVPAFDWSDPAGGFNANVIEKCVATVNGDDTQYFFRILGTNTLDDYSYNNCFRDVVFEVCSGGGIYATSQFGLVIDNCWMWDDPVGGIVAPPFFVGKEPSGLGSRCTVIRNSGRIGDHMAAGVKDLVLHGSCQQTTIDSFRCVPDNGKIDLGDSSYVQFVNKSPGTTLTGTAGYVAYAAEGNTHNGVAMDGRVTGDAHPRMLLKVDGSLQAGSGTTAPDVSLYRDGVGRWRTDDALDIGGHVNAYAGLAVNGVDISSAQPGDIGFKAWAFDPGAVLGGGSPVVSGTIYLTAVNIRKPTTVSNIWIAMANTQPVTAGQCWVGLYNSSGTKLVDVDTSASVNTLGVKTFPVSAQTLPPGLYWIANVINFSGAAPQVMAGNTTSNTRAIANGALSASQYRFCTNGTGTTLPSSITPASNSITGMLTLWAALS